MNVEEIHISNEKLGIVLAERMRQHSKWGEQNHPNGTGQAGSVAYSEESKVRTDEAAAGGSITWEHILTEEYAEALAESDVDKLHDELIQVAAVATAWAEAIDRQRG